MTTVLITGANRGIGLEFVRQYAAEGATVYATCRKPDMAQDLRGLASENVSTHALDVADPAAVAALKREIGAAPVDILINNAGVMPRPQQLGDMDYDAWGYAFAVNTMAPFRMTTTFADNVAAGREKKIAILSTKMGSVADASTGSYAYRSSKAALNIVAHVLANELAGRGILVGLFHPGWVRTDMGGPNGLISAAESVEALRRRLAELSPATSGRFLNYDGHEIPW